MTGERHPRDAIGAELSERDATAFVHVGTADEPSLRYCLPETGDRRAIEGGRYAIAFCDDGEDGDPISFSSDEYDDPAERLAGELTERGRDGTVLAPRHLPHDAALHFEGRGFSLASSDVLDRARAVKTDRERDRIERAQRAAGAGVRRAAAVLSEANAVDGPLALQGESLTPERLRRTIDRAVVDAGAFPAGNTAVGSTVGRDGALETGEPIVLSLAPRGREGYHGGLARTVVVGGEGGPERRAHVAATRALESARAMLTAGSETVGAVEADLAAEVRAFGFEDGIETDVAGVGLEECERPSRDGDTIDSDAVVRLDATVRVDDRVVRVGDLLWRAEGRARWIDAVTRSLDPVASEGGGA